MSSESINKQLDFLRLFRQGCKQIRTLLRDNKAAADLFLYLAENADMNSGAVAVDQSVLAHELECSDRHVRRAIKALEDGGFVRRAGTTVFAINPSIAWGGYDNAMRSSLYMTMDRKSAKKVRYVFNPASENLVPAYVGVEPVAEDAPQSEQPTDSKNKGREVLATQPARSTEPKHNA
ncbi:TPA: replication/maintenance protein RepL [Salmonella enterica]|nr:replication/maintenance protein RepL [Salmonella enterica]MCH5739599.1 replication/maintenance protein RepL [Salmonella enterica]MCH5744693.1 replication/maintenance protein RepL [Salmonella enterica]MCH5749652.1 replication/maintenance protein RepL [Salmonella enterica]MCH5757144.1 replication/maintenance protein RepL [Salmonella enterica]